MSVERSAERIMCRFHGSSLEFPGGPRMVSGGRVVTMRLEKEVVERSGRNLFDDSAPAIPCRKPMFENVVRKADIVGD
jgi:hypothetical protein